MGRGGEVVRVEGRGRGVTSENNDSAGGRAPGGSPGGGLPRGLRLAEDVLDRLGPLPD